MSLSTKIALAEFRFFVSLVGFLVFMLAMSGTKHPDRLKRRVRP